MGRTKGACEAEFPKGTLVRVASRPQLEEFMRTWRFHHPLKQEQLAYADTQGRVAGVSFYHGGDELYLIEGIPGTWHEECLHGLDPVPR